jgi:hypothetical protein
VEPQYVASFQASQQFRKNHSRVTFHNVESLEAQADQLQAESAEHRVE